MAKIILCVCWKNRLAIAKLDLTFWNSNKAKQDILQKCCIQKYTIKIGKLIKTKSYIMIKTVFNKIQTRNLGMFIFLLYKKDFFY